MRWLWRIGAGLATLLVLVATVAWLAMRASLPALDGQATLVGLNEAAVVERDANGVPSVTAADRADLARATGYLHAQDRFFQMDLARRAAAGELAGLIGEAALPRDRKLAPLQLRAVARRALAAAPDATAAMLAAYAEGVNAGLAALGSRPFEYWMLRQPPADWRGEDSLLVVLSMFLILADHQAKPELSKTYLRDVLGGPAADFLAPPGGPWDAPMTGDAFDAPAIPGPADWPQAPGPAVPGEGGETINLARATPPPVLGSNSWAAAGSATTTGQAIVANDMHLGLRLPHTWYRMRLRLTGEPGLDVTGVTLPGVPNVIVGTNGHIAWGFTNSYGDFADIVQLADDQIREQTIELAVAGGEAVTHTIETSDYGPVTRDPLLGPIAVQWSAREPGGVNLALGLLEAARSLDEAMAVANRAGMPPQNIVIADTDGRVAWTLAGRIPKRVGFDGSFPGRRVGNVGWQGWVAPEAAPRIVDPADGLLWTANSRVVSGEELALIGDGGSALGARGMQIRDGLRARLPLDVGDMLAVQLDDRALFLAGWRALLIERLADADGEASAPELATARELVADGARRAAVDDAGYRLVRAFHDAVAERVFAALTAPVRERFPDAPLVRSHQFEHSLWLLVMRQPAHLLPADATSWDALLTAIAVDVIVADAEHAPLADQTWGQANALDMAHPLAAFLPAFVARHLRAPSDPQAGDRDMPRVAGPRFGASQRMGVSPSDPAGGYLTQPGGASGHPLSPYFLAGHDDWLAGRPAPLLPGDPIHQLTLLP